MIFDTDTKMIISKAVEFGASSAGIAQVHTLKKSVSYEIYDRHPYYDNYSGIEWPENARSVLVLALLHNPGNPELDWWSDDIPGRTPGNRQLMRISKKLRKWLKKEFDINAHSLPYSVEAGGIFLKDAAVLAGVGIIGKNNLLITPEFGAIVRLRALFLDKELESTAPLEFDPCKGCDSPCIQVCPQDAFRSGSYDVSLCEQEMNLNRNNQVTVDGQSVGIDIPCKVVKSCRECEFACRMCLKSIEG